MVTYHRFPEILVQLWTVKLGKGVVTYDRLTLSPKNYFDLLCLVTEKKAKSRRLNLSLDHENEFKVKLHTYQTCMYPPRMIFKNIVSVDKSFNVIEYESICCKFYGIHQNITIYQTWWFYV